MLPYPLHGYRTSVRTSTRVNPYSLVYGTKVVLSIKSRLDQLNLIEEKCLTVVCHGQLYQQRMKNTFDKRVRPRVFKEGDLVLKKRLPNIKDPRGKWAPNYEGPYAVKQAFSRGALVVANSEGQELIHPINADDVKMFYP
ncbi:hypothetical protein CR513_24683, partial [Mucuna pruriens]